MYKRKLKICIVVLLATAMYLIFSCVYPALDIIKNLRESTLINLDEYGIFMNVMSLHSNYISWIQIVIFDTLVCIFGLNLMFLPNKPSIILRHKSRKSYIAIHILDSLIFAAAFVFLMEIINVCFSFAVFGKDISLNTNLLFYSFLDFWTMLLFFMRAGIILCIMRVITNEKAAPVIAFSVYLLEYAASQIFPFLQGQWTPYADSISVNFLLSGAMTVTDVGYSVARQCAINAILIFFAFYLFQKKDIIRYEKK